MNFRLILLTNALLTASAIGGCSRDELAPWGFPKDIGINCQDLPGGVAGQPYTLDLNSLITGGVAPFTFEVSGLPPGLTLDPATGIVTGTPTEAGDFTDLVITVTDAAGETRVFDTCGAITIDRPEEAICRDDTGSIPDGFRGIAYTFPMSFDGGREPYTWSAKGLPAGLTVTVEADTSKAVLEGTPTENGDFDIEVVVTDADGVATSTQCGPLLVRDPVQVDHGKLLSDVDGCVPVGDGAYDSLSDLYNQGILGGDTDYVPVTCELKAGRGNGSGDFDKDKATSDTMPPGITLDTDSCTTAGTVTSTLPYGVYGFITTFTQKTTASTVNAYVPYCAANETQAPTAYGITREDTGTVRTFLPGVDQLAPGEGLNYGTNVPDPKVTVDYGQACAGSCFYAFVFSYNTLSGDAVVNANPNAKYPANGFEGFTHGIHLEDPSQAQIDRFAGRAWITNITFDYCIADNKDDCGNNTDDATKRAELVRANGGGSNYYFSVVGVPVQ